MPEEKEQIFKKIIFNQKEMLKNIWEKVANIEVGKED